MQKPFVDEAQYDAMLERSDVRLEWVNGQVRAMANNSPHHATLLTRFATLINNGLGLDSLCEAVAAQQVVACGSANYLPDVVLHCDDNAKFDERRPNVLLNPILFVEVLSDSTARIDREEKLDAYRQIPSLRHYLMVHQNRVRIEHHRRVDEREWRLDIFHWRGETIRFDDLNVEIPIDEIYRRIDVPEGFVLIQNDEGS